MSKKLNQIIGDVKSYLYEDESLLKLPKKKKKDSAKAILVKDIVEPNILEIPSLKLEVEPVQVASHFKDFTTQMKSCHLCSLSRTRHHVVVGDGNPQSMLYIIGEAPGQEEDLQGSPFVGRSGQLLTKMLEAIAIKREDIFITNIVKCRPPNNRDPLPEEITACSPYLKKQIQLGKPKVLLALGRYSAGFLLNDFKSSLGALRGTLHPSEYGSVLVTYHPAAVLRSPNQRKPIVWEDLKFLAQFLYQQSFYNADQIETLKANKALEI